MTTKAQLRRINILIEELEKLRKENPKGKFDMGTWCSIKRAATRLLLRKQILEAIQNPCGTAACLAGKAGLIPRIRRMGFKWDTAKSRGNVADFRYKKLIGNVAVQFFFGSAVFHRVFTRTYSISTLYQGIQALKCFVKDYE